ncbi:Alpha/Beta hydrolase protein [Coniochaeta sp. 2T2.1]|nr:Alpha/Beta hydrolase protein [Coniochaeta sp. 2T2.1]
MSSTPTTHTVAPQSGPHKYTIIFLHGRDSTAADFASELFESEITGGTQADRTLPSILPTVRWVFPQAKQLPSERFGGTYMSQWFDMWSVESPQERSEMQVPGLLASVERLAKIIEEEEKLVPRSRIFLAGISQGFATVLATFLADGKGHFAGLCGFCSWFPLADAVQQACVDKIENAEKLAAVGRVYGGGSAAAGKTRLPTYFADTPILLEHARNDEVVPVANGRHMRDLLEKLGLGNIEWWEYEDGGHWINEPKGWNRFYAFLLDWMYRCGF